MWCFTVHVADLEEFTDELTNRLYEAGCSDGTLASSRGRSHIGFSREAATLQEAIRSAVADIGKVGLRVDRVEIGGGDLAAWPLIAEAS